jgi:UPF0271 protein
MSLAEISGVVIHQLQTLRAIASGESARVRHVKPHGALYNLACRDFDVANAIAEAIGRVDRGLCLYAPHGSALARAGETAGLRVVAEGFLDRAYEDDGGLTSRDVPGAVLVDPEAARIRAIEWVRTGQVRTRTGHLLSLPLETLCVHGDTPDAAAIAAQVRDALVAAGVRLAAPLQP